jgi:hypothetical protein
MRVTQSGSSAFIPVDAGYCHELSAAFDRDPAMGLLDRVELRIEGVTGNLPVPLAVYLGLPVGADPASQSENLGGTLGLYGLRQASAMQADGKVGRGMGFSLDVTHVFIRTRLAGPPTPTVIRVSVMPNKPLPDQVAITIGRMSFIHVRE